MVMPRARKTACRDADPGEVEEVGLEAGGAGDMEWIGLEHRFAIIGGVQRRGPAAGELVTGPARDDVGGHWPPENQPAGQAELRGTGR